jgi:hypothetical protein
MNHMIRNMNKKNRQHATVPLIFINKTINFYLQYVFVRIIFIFYVPLPYILHLTDSHPFPNVPDFAGGLI